MWHCTCACVAAYRHLSSSLFWTNIVCYVTEPIFMGNLAINSKRVRMNSGLTTQHILKRSVPHTHTHCVWAAVHLSNKKEAVCLCPGISKHPQHKQVPLETEEKLTPSGQLQSRCSSAFDVLQRELIMKAPLHLNSFNWSVDVTGCWHFVVTVLAWCELGTYFEEIPALAFTACRGRCRLGI